MNYSPSKKQILQPSIEYWDNVEIRVNQYLDSLGLVFVEPGFKSRKEKNLIVLKKEGFTIKERRRRNREQEERKVNRGIG
jgi:hypothetical protein